MSSPTRDALDDAVDACRSLILERFPGADEDGAAAMLLADGTILTGTAPDAVNPSAELCHEVEPYAAAHRLGQPILASICLVRDRGRFIALSPCGICRERLAVHGPGVLAAVADPRDSARIVWKELRELLPDYWLRVFPDEAPRGWV